MSETESTNKSWIAGLMERRIALGIALLASILLIVFMLRPSENPYKKSEKNLHVMVPATSSPPSAANQTGAGPKGQGPTYSIPQKPAKLPQVPATPVQPSPTANPVSTTPPAKASASPGNTAAVPGSASKQEPASRAQASAHGYFVQIGSYRDLSNARKVAARMMREGWSSSISVNAAGLNTVRIGPVTTRSAAEKLRQRLLDKAKLKGFIVKE